MAFWKAISRLLDPTLVEQGQPFVLDDRGDAQAEEPKETDRLAETELRAGGVVTHIDNMLKARDGDAREMEKAGDLSTSLAENIERIKALFRMPENKDLVVRELVVATQPPTQAAALFMEGLSDKTIVNRDILQPLMLLSHLDHHVDGEGEHGPTRFTIATVLKRLLPGNQVSEKTTVKDVAASLLAGDSVVLFEGSPTGLAVETKGFPVRSVSTPQTERVIQGPQDSFNESFRMNAAMIRRRLKDPRVVTDILTVGKLSNTYVGVMYVDGIVSPKLVAEVTRRIKAINVDIITSSGILEQYIEDSPSSLLPGMLTTERPDRAAAYLSEGHVAIVVDGSPYALLAPGTFWSLLQTAEDYYLRYPFGTLVRLIRLTALLTALMVPALYIAVVNYHPEMIPTDLALFIAASREAVPMSTVTELVLMDLGFELIREAGTRIPSVIGPTVGLVASLVLGQAAVEAKLVSPLMILIVAITGLSSFAIPNYLTSFGIRSLRFLMLASAVVLGFYGVAVASFILLIHLASMRSFGVPFLAPVAPAMGGVSDVLIRPPVFRMEMRPSYTHPVERRRQAQVVRGWDPNAKQQEKPEDGGDQS